VRVQVPAYLFRDNTGCFAFKPQVPASCQTLVPDESVGTVMIYVGRYPPLFYLATGLASRAVPGVAGIYAMRLVSLLVSAALLASALTSLAQIGAVADRRWAGLGVLVAVTPMAAFLFGVLNPSGPEIAAAVATWVTGYLLVRAEGPVDRRVVVRLAVAAAVLLLTRPVGLVWVALVGLALLVLAGRPRIAELWRPIAVRLAVGGLVVLGALQGVWLVAARSFEFADPNNLRSGPWSGFLLESVGFFWDHGFGQMIGNFGWLDTPAPRGATALWQVLVGFVLLCGIARARGRALVVLGGTLVLTVVLPAVVDAQQMPRGFGWQGRYTLPLAVGIPLVAAFEAGRRDRPALFEHRRLFAVAAAGVVVAQVACFGQALRRNSVGRDGPLLFWTEAAWTAHHVPGLLLVTAYLAVVAAFAAVTVVLVPAPAGGDASAPPTGPASAASRSAAEPVTAG
jgi:hypothetical protein